MVNRRLGKTDQAIKYFTRAKAIRIRELGENDTHVAGIYNNMGLAYKTRSEFDSARYYFEKAVQIKNLSNDQSVYLNYINLGELMAVLGDYQKALNFYAESEKILILQEDSLKLADLYVNMGGIYNVLKSNTESYSYFQNALSIYSGFYGNSHENIAKLYQNLANVYHDINDNVNEKKSIVKAISIYEEIYGENSEESASIYNNLAFTFEKDNQLDSAIYYSKKTLKIYENVNQKESEKYLNTASNLGRYYLEQNQPEQAKFFLNMAYSGLKELYKSSHPQLSNVANYLSQLAINEGDTVTADIRARQAVTYNVVEKSNFFLRYKTSLDPFLLFESYLLLAKTNRKNPELALAFYYKADSVITQQRNFIFDRKDKIRLAANSKKLTFEVLHFISEVAPPSKSLVEIAFEFIEKSKSRVLLQSITENQGKKYSGIPEEVILEEEKLLRLITLFEHEVSIEKDSAARADTELKLFRYKQNYKRLVQNLEKNYTSYYRLKYNDVFPAIADLQNEIDSETLVLNYFVFNETIFCLSVCKTNSSFKKIPKADFDDLLTGMRKGILFKLNNVFMEKSYALGKLLLPDNIHDFSKLKIVPDGGLNLLPFEALLTDSVFNTENINEWPFLIKSFDISYTPSNSIFLNKKVNVANNQPQKLLAIAPVFSFEPSQDNGKNNSKNILLNNLGVSSLKFSVAEMQNVQNVFEQNGIANQLFINNGASKNIIVNDELSNYSHIHIATHGFVDKSNPELSGLFFFPTTAEKSESILYSGEVYNLKLNAELLTLSACETALGKIEEGEGLFGFSRAFLYAGAKNLLLSLWKVNDQSTASFMSIFYTQLIENNLEISAAASYAKRELVNGNQFAHPYYWASFIHIGN